MPDPQVVNRKLLSTSRGSKGFSPINAAEIGERGATQKALIIVAGRYKERNPRVIKSRLMKYKEVQLGTEFLAVAEDELANISVWVVEMVGVFKVRNQSRREVPASTLSYTKAYVIIKAADGLELGSRLFAD